MKHAKLIVLMIALSLMSLALGAITAAKCEAAVYGTGSAKIAVMEPSVQTISVALPKLLPGSAAEVKVSINNFDGSTISEVAMNYTVEFSTLGNLPITLKGSINQAGSSCQAGSCTSSFSASHSRQTQILTLTCSWPADKNDFRLENQADTLLIRFHAVQADH